MNDVIERAKPKSKVAVLGASRKPSRYSFMAVQMLQHYGHIPVPVHPAGHSVDGLPGVRSLAEIKEGIDTLTVYVNPNISSVLLDSILHLKPRRVIFNPGAENRDLAQKLAQDGIAILEACTLVMLRTEQF